MRRLFSLFLFVIIVLSLFLISSKSVEARIRVRGYYNRYGTYVEPYYRSSPNVYRWDNYSYKDYQPRYNNSYYYRSYNYNSPFYTPDYSYTWYRWNW